MAGRIFRVIFPACGGEKEKRAISVTWAAVKKGRVFASGLGDSDFARGGRMAIDPVCGMRVEEKKAELQTQFAGKKYFFCSEECRKEFESEPDEYIIATAA
jgi:YHS domain-containing protein